MDKLNSLIKVALVATGIAACAAQAQAAEPRAKVVYDDSTKTMTFYYDDQTYTNKTSKGVTQYDFADYPIEGSSSADMIPWYNSEDGHPATNVAFAASFAGFAPKGMQNWFNNFPSLKGLTGLENLDMSCATNVNSIFKDCTSLTALDLSNHNMGKLYRTDSMFFGCKSLTSVNLSGVNMPGVRILLNMFNGCKSLTSLNVSGVHVPNVRWMNGMFKNCTSLTKLDLRGFGTKNCERASNMFNGCSKLTTIVVSDAFTLPNIPESSQDTSANMFKDCTSLVGGRGTKFDSTKAVDKTFAKIDGGTASPGYFTAPPVPVTYVDADGKTQTTNAFVVESSETRMTWNAGWYVVTNEVTVKGGADCSGEVHLILADTGALTISGVAGGKAGIAVSGSGNSLAIYGQAAGTGALTVSGGASSAGIGGGEGSAGSDITINGGTVTANGRDAGAGIGGGYHGLGSNIRINGGKVTATGGTSSASGIGSGDGGGDASKIYAADDVIVKAGAKANPTTEIAHLGDQDIAFDLAGKQYVTAEKVPPPAEVTITDVAGATAKVYTNKTEITERPAKIKYGMAFDVVYTADAGYMFPGGHQTFETNLTANADEITVTLTAGQQPVAAQACEDCIAFTSANSFTLKTANGQKNWDGTLETSTDKIYWTEWKGAEVTAAQAGGAYNLYVRGDAKNTVITGEAEPKRWILTVDDNGKVACTGNIETLRGATGDGPSPTTMGEYCYFSMFYNCAALTTAPALPASDLAKHCYASMFKSCTALTAAPTLPAMKMSDSCYNTMFKSCTALTAAPALPSTNLAISCYGSMFSGCTSLTDVPELPAMKMIDNCYEGMFRECKALTDIPELPATNLAEYCYSSMFQSCAALEVNTNGMGKAWSIPEKAEVGKDWNKNMFKSTAGSITNTTVTPGVTYYVASALVPVTVVVPEVAGATAQLYAFDVNGGWRPVETNAVPSNATVRVVWTAADDKVLTAEDAVNVYEWQTEFVADKALQTAPAPTVGDDGESEVAVRIDTRATKRYFDAADVLPIWYAQGSEVKVRGEGEQSWDTLVKSSANTNTLAWKPTAEGVYKLSHTAFENATIILATPVEVTTNGLEVAGTTVKVTDESGNPLVAQTEEPFKGKIIVPSNSTVKVVWTATEKGKYFLDGSTTYTQTFTADKPVNAVSEAVKVPEEPKEPSVKVGIVGQRYPWDGKLDVQYWAKNTPNKGYLLKVTVTLPDGKEESETGAALSGVNTTVFDMRKVFGEVTVKGATVKAELEKGEN